MIDRVSVNQAAGGLIRRCGLCLVAVMFLLTSVRSGHAQEYVNLPLLGWPLDDEHRLILAYPDTPYTWALLGLTEGSSCPRYYERDYATSYAMWRDPALPEVADWLQASLGNQGVACYRNHRGVDIIAPPLAPVYALADGVVTLAEPRVTEGFEDAAIEIDHRREYRDVTYDWIGHYAHLANRLLVEVGDSVKVGQLIGYVAPQGASTHLHVAVEGIWDCATLSCIQNPFGPVDAWIDFSDNGAPDPAPSLLPDAPPNVNLVRNGGFDTTAGWFPTESLLLAPDSGSITLTRTLNGGRAALEQALPYRFPAGRMVRIKVTLENISDRSRYVGISLRGSDTWLGYVGCPFMLAPETPRRRYVIQGRIGHVWGNAILAVSVGPADGLPAVRLDDIQAEIVPDMGESEGCDTLPDV